ncbi:MAG: hypothetical protein V1886_03880 [archaeon]
MTNIKMVQIIGFNLTKAFAEREKEIKGQVTVKHNIEVKDVRKESVTLSKDKDVVCFDFEFSVSYEPKLAKIIFEGNVLILAEPKETKEILKNWKKKEGIENIRLLVYNTILAKCSVKALQLESDLNLPSHIPLPKLAPAKQVTNYAG